MKIIITGATGMAGSEVLRQAINDNGITEMTAIVRKPLTTEHPKLTTIIHKDFMDYSGLQEVFKNNDACLWCLGISQNAVDENQYITITYDYTLAAANAMLQANPFISFLFLSGDGASSDEKSRFLFGRIKGKTENALTRLPFRKLYIARPAGILPANSSASFPFALRLQYLFVRIMRYITPAYVITSVNLAKTLLYIIKNGPDKTIFSFREINDIAKGIN